MESKVIPYNGQEMKAETQLAVYVLRIGKGNIRVNTLGIHLKLTVVVGVLITIPYLDLFILNDLSSTKKGLETCHLNFVGEMQPHKYRTLLLHYTVHSYKYSEV